MNAEGEKAAGGHALDETNHGVVVKAEAGPSRAVEGRVFSDGTAPITAQGLSVRQHLRHTQNVEQARHKDAN